MPKRKYTDADLLAYLEGLDANTPLNWTEAANALGYRHIQALRRRAKLVGTLDKAARTLTLPSGKVLQLRRPGREAGVPQRKAEPSNAAALEGVRRARIARAAQRRKIILAHLGALAERGEMFALGPLAEALGVATRAQASRLLREVEGLTVTAATVTLPDGRTVPRDVGGRPDKSDPSQPTARQREIAERRAARAEAHRARVDGLTAYLEHCLAAKELVTLDGLRKATGYGSAGAARKFLNGLAGYALESDAVVLPDGRRVDRLPQGFTLQNGRAVKKAPACAPAKPRKATDSNKTRPRAAAVGAGASPKPVSLPSSPAPRASSLRTTVGAGAKTPLPRASAGSSNVVEMKAPRVPLARDVFPPAGGCVWPHGDVGDEGFHFCGAESLPGRPYCRRHYARAYRPRVTAEAAE